MYNKLNNTYYHKDAEFCLYKHAGKYFLDVHILMAWVDRSAVVEISQAQFELFLQDDQQVLPLVHEITERECELLAKEFREAAKNSKD